MDTPIMDTPTINTLLLYCHRLFFILAYGVDLTTLLKTHGTKVPFVIKECVDELERRGK